MWRHSQPDALSIGLISNQTNKTAEVSMIETRLLQQFIAVAEELRFSRAAERLHMAQPPLSQTIRRLESEIGSQLFERTNRSVALTPAGAALLETARRILQSLDDGLAHTRRVAQGLEGHLTMAFINIVPYAPPLRALRDFRLASPGVVFTPCTCSSRPGTTSPSQRPWPRA